ANYAFTLSAIGGLPPYNWSLINAPSWMVLDPLTGDISGFIGAEVPFGSYPLTVILKDSINATVSKQFNLHIVDTLAVDELVLPEAETSRTYFYKLKAYGGAPEYTWTILSGNKPSGIA